MYNFLCIQENHVGADILSLVCKVNYEAVIKIITNGRRRRIKHLIQWNYKPYFLLMWVIYLTTIKGSRAKHVPVSICH